MSISFLSTGTNGVTVGGFDIAPYANRNVSLRLIVTDLFDDSVLSNTDYSQLSTTGITSIVLNAVSRSGITLTFQGNTFNMGVDNLSFSAEGPTPPVPLPAGFMLLGGALLGTAALRRHTRAA